MKREFDLRYENTAGDLGYKGTIRTTPENYYVCSVDKYNHLHFRDLEAETRNIDWNKVFEWWNNYLLLSA